MGRRGGLRPCELCGAAKGYPTRVPDHITHADGGKTYLPRTRWICWPCREKAEAAIVEAFALGPSLTEAECGAAWRAARAHVEEGRAEIRGASANGSTVPLAGRPGTRVA